MSSSRIVLGDAPVELVRGDVRWPKGLEDLPDAPASLRVAGRLPSFERAVAIVGTRYADDDALEFTRQLAASLASRGVAVVSGGASGIDAAAHEGALSAGGSTVAVLAYSLARAYPPQHGPLFSEIARASGALVCEGPDRPRPLPAAFLRRNRLIAALVEAVVVVQAPVKSGALSTAAWAKRLKRRLFAVPMAPWEARGAGCLVLLRQGAHICTSAADVLSLPASDAGQGRLPLWDASKDAKDDAGLHESSRRVLQALQAGRQHPDDLARVLGMGMADLQQALLGLVLAGRVRQHGDGTYLRAPD